MRGPAGAGVGAAGAVASAPNAIAVAAMAGEPAGEAVAVAAAPAEIVAVPVVPAGVGETGPVHADPATPAETVIAAMVREARAAVAAVPATPAETVMAAMAREPREGAAAGPATPAETLVAAMAREIEDGAVVATGVASPLAILAIAVARATHAPRLTYLACVGALDPEIATLHPCSEDLGYLAGRAGEVTIPELFDHARRGRIDLMFFGAAEVDGTGDTNLSAAGPLERPRVKFPGVAGAASLRRWVARPVVVVGRQSRRNLVLKVQVASTSDPGRRTRLLTDLGVFELGAGGAALVARHAWAGEEEIAARTGFPFRSPRPLPVTPAPSAESLRAIRRLDPAGLRDRQVG
jgi:glutaconate CoA-transferase subunit B